jgi:hypothetical protein
LSYHGAVIREPGNDPAPVAATAARRRLSPRVWILACVALVLLTWTPVLGIHLRNMSLANPALGTVVVVFSPTLSTRDLFRSVADAKGTPVRPVDWIPRAWVVQSGEPGFVGRLRERGAWGVYSTELFSLRRILSCSGMVSPPAQLSLPAP